MKIEKIEIEGFGVFKNKQTINFTNYPENSIIGVFGINQDGEGGYDSNGSGKSTILNAISWCLFDRIPVQADKESAIAKESIVNDKADKAIVTLYFYNQDDYISFTNTRSIKGTQKVYLSINGEEWRGNTNSQKRDKLMSLLGIGGKNKAYYTDFLNHCYFTGELTKSFASKNYSDSKRLEVVSRIRKLEIYDLAIDLVKKDAKVNNDMINTLETKISQLEEKIDATFNLDVALDEIKRLENNKIDFEAKVKEIEVALEADKLVNELKLAKVKAEQTKQQIMSYIDNEYDKAIRDFKRLLVYDKSIKQFKESLSKIDESEIDISSEGKIINIETQMNTLIIKQSTLYNEIEKAKKELKDLKSKHYLVCPNCNNKLLLENKLLVLVDEDSLNRLLKSKEDFINSTQQSLILIEKESKDLDNNKLELKRQLNASREIFNKIEGLKSSIISTERSIEQLFDSNWMIKEKDNFIFKEENSNYSLYDEYNEIVQEIKSIENQINNIPVSQYKSSDISYISNQINLINLNINKIENLINDQNNIKVELKTFRTKLGSSNLDREKYEFWILNYKRLKNIELLETEPLLEAATNKVLSELGTSMEVSYKVDEDAGGLSITLTEDSGQIRPLELFSTGQANRIGFAAGLALKSLNQTSALDFGFTLWDEVLDGLDNTGQDKFFDILRDLSGLKLVISHDINLKQFFEHKLTVIRKAHESIIKI